jgi:hypothetical protein
MPWWGFKPTNFCSKNWTVVVEKEKSKMLLKILFFYFNPFLSGIVAVDGDWTVDDTVWFARRVVNSAFVSIVKDIAYDSVDDNIRWRKKFRRQRHDGHIRGQGDQIGRIGRIGRLFSMSSLWKITEVAQSLGLLFSKVPVMY